MCLQPIGFFSAFDCGAYGWKGAMKIAREGAELGGENAPDNNADTIALFAIGMSPPANLMDHG